MYICVVITYMNYEFVCFILYIGLYWSNFLVHEHALKMFAYLLYLHIMSADAVK